jgi:hypothetical protein
LIRAGDRAREGPGDRGRLGVGHRDAVDHRDVVDAERCVLVGRGLPRAERGDLEGTQAERRRGGEPSLARVDAGESMTLLPVTPTFAMTLPDVW